MKMRWAVAAASACLVGPLLLPAAPASAAPGVVPLPGNLMDVAQVLIGGDGVVIEDELVGNGLAIKSVSLRRADGTGLPQAAQSGLFTDLPSGWGMTEGVILTTGTPAAVRPDPEAPASSVDHSTQSGLPSDWLSANGNQVPGNTIEGPGAYDPVMLTIEAEMQGSMLEVDWAFASEEFGSPDPYNDVALILVDSQFAGQPANPTDKNCALLPGENGPVPATVKSLDQAASYFRLDPDDMNSGFAGTTTPQTCQVRVVPGETVRIRFVVWDGGDGTFDSGLLLGADSLRSGPPASPELEVIDRTTLRKLRDNGLPTTIVCFSACSPKVRVTIPAKLAKSLDISGTQVGDNVVIGTKQITLTGSDIATPKVTFSSKTLNKLGRAKADVVKMKASLVGVAGTTETVAVKIR